MAKGDKQKHQAQIDKQGDIFQNSQNKMMDSFYTNQDMFRDNYKTGTQMNMDSYKDIMGGYRGILDNPDSLYGSGYGPPGKEMGYDYKPSHATFNPESRGGYREFATTGGLSEADRGNLRARGIAPTRAIYEQGNQNIERQKRLQGGYAPSAIAAQSRNNREMNQAISDVNTNVNADIAQMVQQGRLAGLGGLKDLDFGDLDTSKFNAGTNNEFEQLRGSDKRFYDTFNANNASQYNNDIARSKLAALGGMTDLYGATPGMANLFGSQLLGQGGQLLQGQGLQGDWGNSMINNQMQNSQIPSNFSTAMGRIGTGLKYAGQIGAAIGTGGASLLAPGGGIYGPGGLLKNTPKVTPGLGNSLGPASNTGYMPTGIMGPMKGGLEVNGMPWLGPSTQTGVNPGRWY